MYTIMVVDDSTFIVDVFVTMLERGGYKTLSAYGGQECLDLLRTERPDLILLDIMMEPMDGRETLERIKTNPETKDIPVMMLTAKQLAPDEAQEYAIYVEDYVLKPITHRELYDVIEYILNRRARIRQDVEAARAAGVDQAGHRRVRPHLEEHRGQPAPDVHPRVDLQPLGRTGAGRRGDRAGHQVHEHEHHLPGGPSASDPEPDEDPPLQPRVRLSISPEPLRCAAPILPAEAVTPECRAPPERARAGFQGGAFARAPQVAVEPGRDRDGSCAPARPGRMG